MSYLNRSMNDVLILQDSVIFQQLNLPKEKNPKTICKNKTKKLTKLL